MPTLLRHPLARLVATTAVLGSLADWVLFATLVVTVDTLVGGGPWATALVLLVRIAPAAAFAPLAARRVDGADLRTTLVRHELLRVVAVGALVVAFTLQVVPAILAGLLVLEFAAAMQAAARESAISRHVPASAFTALNTVTAVVGYGLLPVGAVVVAAAGAPTGWAVAITGYATLAVVYATRFRVGATATPVVTASPTPGSLDTTTVAPATGHAWRRVTVAAALGVLPVVALFALGPTFAETWLADRARTGPLYAAVLVGGAGGFALANLRRLRADVAMLLAASGLVVAAIGAWLPGLVLLGVGAGAAYLDLQTRLQHAASSPSEFATAFAILKVASAVAVAGAPLLATVAPLSVVLVVGAVSALVGAAVATGAASRPAQRAVRGVLRVLARAVLRVEVAAPERRVGGPAVVVSNHPHWLDGVVALLADDDLRPVARRQRHPGARLGIWAAGAVVTTRPADDAAAPSTPRRPAFAEAAQHLLAGGRVWLAPEGGAHTGQRLRAPRSGAVRMAHLAGVPVQPLSIAWADHPAGPHLRRWRPWRRRVVHVGWGDPVATTGDVAVDNRAMMAALADATGMARPHDEVPAAA